MGKREATQGLSPYGDLDEEVHHVRASDGVSLALSEVSLPGRPARGARLSFLLIHGFSQGRFAFLAGPLPKLLLERGARVFLGELRGHGRNRRVERSEWNAGAHLHRDLPALLSAVRGLTGGLPLHYVGHSLGGMLGYALASRPGAPSSVIGFAAPLSLAKSRALVRLAAALSAPLVRVARRERLPVDLLLRGLSEPLTRPEARGAVRLLQRLVALADPKGADPEVLRALLVASDAESTELFLEIISLIRRERSLAGVELERSVREARAPIAGVCGTRDLLAPLPTMQALREGAHRGPRELFVVEGGTHVDLPVGHHLEETFERLWRFVSSAPERP